MPKRLKKEMAEIQTAIDKPLDPKEVYEMAVFRLSLDREMLAELESGTHGFGNRVELTTSLIESLRSDIIHREKTILEYEALAASRKL